MYNLAPYSNIHDVNLDWIIAIIKSIDPSVIKKLQNLTPDAIEQINQSVEEAKSFAIAAKSSALDANTSKNTAEAKASEAAQEAINASADAVRAENAANNATAAVNTALEPTTLTVNATSRSTISDSMCIVSGKIATIFISGNMNSKVGGNFTTCAEIANWPGRSAVRFSATILRDGAPIKKTTAILGVDSGIRLPNSAFDVNDSFQIDTATGILPANTIAVDEFLEEMTI